MGKHKDALNGLRLALQIDADLNPWEAACEIAQLVEEERREAEEKRSLARLVCEERDDLKDRVRELEKANAGLKSWIPRTLSPSQIRYLELVSQGMNPGEAFEIAGGTALSYEELQARVAELEGGDG